MTKKLILHKGVVATCRDCNHAILVRTDPNNPVLAQCKLQPTTHHPHRDRGVNVATAPACPKFDMWRDSIRPVKLVNWRD